MAAPAPAVRLVLRLPEAARALALREEAVRELLRSGQLDGYRTAGGHWRIPIEGLHSYIARRCREETDDREITKTPPLARRGEMKRTAHDPLRTRS